MLLKRLAQSFHLVLVVALLSSSPAVAQDGQPPASLPDEPKVSAALASLWDQMNSPGSRDVASTDYEGSTFSDTQAADDFTLPPGAGGFWEIDQIAVQGTYPAGGQATGVKVFIYSNGNNNLPGTPIYTSPVLTPTSGLNTGDFVLDISPAVTLTTSPQGGVAYWLSVQAVMTATTFQWQWSLRAVQNTSPAGYKRAIGQCSGWGILTGCVAGVSDPDLMFAITGTDAVIGAGPVVFNTDPPEVLVGSPAITLTVNGTNFVQTDTVASLLWNGLERTYITATLTNAQMVAIIPETDLTPAGTVTVTVRLTKGEATVTSNPWFFTIRKALIYLPVIQK